MECLTTPLNVSPRVNPEGEDHKTFWFGNQTRGPLRPPRINTLGVHGNFKRCEPAAPDRLVAYKLKDFPKIAYKLNNLLRSAGTQ